MTNHEMKIVSKIGPSTWAIFCYIRKWPLSRDIDIQADLGVSQKTVSTSLKKLTEYKIISRDKLANGQRVIDTFSEENWCL